MNGNVFDIEGKSPTLTTNKGEGAKVGRIAGISFGDNGIRPFTKRGGGCKKSAPSLTNTERPVV